MKTHFPAVLCLATAIALLTTSELASRHRAAAAAKVEEAKRNIATESTNLQNEIVRDKATTLATLINSRDGKTIALADAINQGWLDVPVGDGQSFTTIEAKKPNIASFGFSNGLNSVVLAPAGQTIPTVHPPTKAIPDANATLPTDDTDSTSLLSVQLGKINDKSKQLDNLKAQNVSIEDQSIANEERQAKIYELYMPGVISLIILVYAMWVIGSKKFTDQYIKWAFGMIGLIVGYWLKTK